MPRIEVDRFLGQAFESVAEAASGVPALADRHLQQTFGVAYTLSPRVWLIAIHKMKAKSPWLVHGARHDQALMRLICFPYAGAGASAFRKWPISLPCEIELIAIQPPGRESRFKEPLPTNIQDMAVAIADALATHLDLPYATFGHSLGALLSYETVLELRRRSMQLPSQMIVSGRGAPHVKSKRADYHGMLREHFVEELRKMQGTPEEVLDSEELMGLLLPMLRADFAMNATYDVTGAPPLPCKMTVYGGVHDVEIAETDLVAWKWYTSGAFSTRMFQGGHFFLNSHRDLVIASVISDLSALNS